MTDLREVIGAIEPLEWESTFKTKRVNSKHSFSMFMCDPATCELQQKLLLHPIIFHDCHSPEHWATYIDYLWKKDDQNRAKIRRLMTVALDSIDQSEHRDNQAYILLRLRAIKGSSTCRAKYKQMEKEQVGIRCAKLYLDWSAAELAAKKLKEALVILKKGKTANALPREQLDEQLNKLLRELEAVSASSTSTATSSSGRSGETHATSSSKSTTVRTSSLIDDAKKYSRQVEKDDNMLGTRKRRQLSGSCQRLQQKSDLDDSIIQIKKSKRAATSAVSRRDSGDDSSTDEVTMEMEADTVALPVSVANTAVDEKVSKALLRKKYLDTLPAVDLTRFDKRKRISSLSTTTSSDNDLSSESKPRQSLDRTSSTATSVSSDEDVDTITIKENLSSVHNGADQLKIQSSTTEKSEVNVATDPNTTSSDMDFVTILENDLPKSVPLLQPSKDILKEQAPTDSRKRRVSFAGNEDCESLASLLHSSSESVPCDVPKDHEVPPATNSKSAPGISSRVPEAQRDAEIDFKKMKTSKKHKSKDSSYAGKSHEIKRFELNQKGYMQLSVLGKGASSTVHRVMADADCQLYAYKRVDMKNDSVEDMEQTIASYSNEIDLLNKCKGNPYIIELVDYVIDRDQAYIAMIMEAGEIDLSSALSNQKKLRRRCSQPGFINPHFLRTVWEGMLRSVDHIHELRIVHGDLKPANFVFVRGDLKLIDFGISKGISNDTTNIVRDSLVGTINYMAPEAVMPTLIPVASGSDVEDEKKKVKYGRASDIWSLGCILYQMLFGATPFATIKNLPSKIGAIVNPLCEIQYPATDDEDAVDAIKLCLVRDLHKRVGIRGEGGLLGHRLLQAPQPSTVSVRGSLQKKQAELVSAGVNTEEMHEVGTTCSLEKASDLVEYILEKRNSMIRGDVTRRELCQQACNLINAPPKESSHPQSASKKSSSRKPLQLLPKSLVDQIRLQKSNIEGSESSGNSQISSDKENCTGSKPVFVPGMVKLKDLQRSDSSKWMRPKGQSPEKKDMKSHLEKSLGNMRHFLEADADDTMDSTHQDDFSFF